MESGFYDMLLSNNKLRESDIAPDVEPFMFYIDAYRELSTSRPSSFSGVSPIPFSAIVEYAKIYEVEDFFEFLYLIRVMDNALIDMQSKSDKKGKSK